MASSSNGQICAHLHLMFVALMSLIVIGAACSRGPDGPAFLSDEQVAERVEWVKTWTTLSPGENTDPASCLVEANVAIWTAYHFYSTFDFNATIRELFEACRDVYYTRDTSSFSFGCSCQMLEYSKEYTLYQMRNSLRDRLSLNLDKTLEALLKDRCPLLYEKLMSGLAMKPFFQ